MDGFTSRGKRVLLQAQRRVAERPELNASVIYVESRTFAAKYTCLRMNDTVCEGKSDEDCQDLIDALKELEPDYKEHPCGYNVNGEQSHHWSWNAWSYFKVGQKMGEVALTLAPALALKSKPV